MRILGRFQKSVFSTVMCGIASLCGWKIKRNKWTYVLAPSLPRAVITISLPNDFETNSLESWGGLQGEWTEGRVGLVAFLASAEATRGSAR